MLDEIKDVADHKEAIKKKIAPVLDAHPTTYLTIKATTADKDTNTVELDAKQDLESIPELFGIRDRLVQESFAQHIQLLVYPPSCR